MNKLFYILLFVINTFIHANSKANQWVCPVLMGESPTTTIFGGEQFENVPNMIIQVWEYNKQYKLDSGERLEDLIILKYQSSPPYIYLIPEQTGIWIEDQKNNKKLFRDSYIIRYIRKGENNWDPYNEYAGVLQLYHSLFSEKSYWARWDLVQACESCKVFDRVLRWTPKTGAHFIGIKRYKTLKESGWPNLPYYFKS